MRTWFALVFIAQTTDALSGNSGWVGTGLLGAVLSWLLFIHLPSKDKLFRDYVTTKDAQLDKVMDRKWEILEKMTKEFSANLRTVTDHCEREVDAAVLRHAQQLNVFHELSDAIRLLLDEHKKKL